MIRCETNITLGDLYNKLSKYNVFYGYISFANGTFFIPDFIDKYSLDKTRISLFYIHKNSQTYEACLSAVRRNGGELYFVKNQTDYMCLEAVRNDGSAIHFVKNKTAELCYEAIKQNPPCLYTYRHSLEAIINKKQI